MSWLWLIGIMVVMVVMVEGDERRGRGVTSDHENRQQASQTVNSTKSYCVGNDRGMDVGFSLVDGRWFRLALQGSLIAECSTRQKRNRCAGGWYMCGREKERRERVNWRGGENSCGVGIVVAGTVQYSSSGWWCVSLYKIVLGESGRSTYSTVHSCPTVIIGWVCIINISSYRLLWYVLCLYQSGLEKSVVGQTGARWWIVRRAGITEV